MTSKVVLIILFLIIAIFESTAIEVDANGTDICYDVINSYKTKGGNVRDCTQSRNGNVYWRIEDL